MGRNNENVDRYSVAFCVNEDRKVLDREGRTFLLNLMLPASLGCQGPGSFLQTDFSIGVDPFLDVF